jgi:hypothetical protein
MNIKLWLELFYTTMVMVNSGPPIFNPVFSRHGQLPVITINGFTRIDRTRNYRDQKDHDFLTGPTNCDQVFTLKTYSNLDCFGKIKISAIASIQFFQCQSRD